MKIYDFEPMSIGRILDNTFRIYKDNFIRFVTIVAVIQVPISILVIISTSALQRAIPVRKPVDYRPSSQGDQQNRESGSTIGILNRLWFLLPGMLVLFGQILCSGMLAKSVSESYLGNRITVKQAYGFVFPKFLTLVLASICVVLFVYFGLLLLVVPGIIFGLWFALTTPAVIVENLKATKGMSRSKALVSGNLGKTFSVGLLVFLLVLVVSISFGYTASFLGRVIFANNKILVSFLCQSVAVLARILVVPIGATAYILLYYDLRIRKEGFDLQMLDESMG